MPSTPICSFQFLDRANLLSQPEPLFETQRERFTGASSDFPRNPTGVIGIDRAKTTATALKSYSYSKMRNNTHHETKHLKWEPSKVSTASTRWFLDSWKAQLYPFKMLARNACPGCASHQRHHLLEHTVFVALKETKKDN